MVEDLNNELEAFLNAEETNNAAQPTEPISAPVAPTSAAVTTETPAAVTTETPAAPLQTVEPQEEVQDNNGLIEVDDFAPTLSNKTPQQLAEEHGVRENVTGQTLTVKSWEWTKPKTYKLSGGIKIPIAPFPEQKKDESDEAYAKRAKFYTIKLKVRFFEDNLVEFYPSVNVFINDGKLNTNISIYRKGNSKLSQMLRMIFAKMSGDKFNLVTKVINDKNTITIDEEQAKLYAAFSGSKTDEEALTFLIGKKVLIETTTGDFEGNAWFRNDIKEIL